MNSLYVAEFVDLHKISLAEDGYGGKTGVSTDCQKITIWVNSQSKSNSLNGSQNQTSEALNFTIYKSCLINSDSVILRKGKRYGNCEVTELEGSKIKLKVKAYHID